MWSGTAGILCNCALLRYSVVYALQEYFAVRPDTEGEEDIDALKSNNATVRAENNLHMPAPACSLRTQSSSETPPLLWDY